MSLRSALAALALSSAMTSLPVAALVIALPAIHSEFDVSLDELQWTMNAYSLAYTAALITAGRLGDLFGRRRLFLAGTALYGAASAFTALSEGVWWLVGGVTVVAIGAAGLTPAALSIIRSSFPEERRGRAIAVWAGASTLVSGLAPALGGILTDQLDWRWIFWVNAILAGVVLALGLRSTPDSRDQSAERRLDLAGLVCLAPALVVVSFGLIEADDIGWTSPALHVLLGAGVALIAAFILVERRARAPLVDFGLFRRRGYAGAAVAAFVFNFALSALFFFAPLYLHEQLGYSSLETGLLMLPLSGALALALPLGGSLGKRFDPRLPILGGLAVCAAGLFLFSEISLSTRYLELWPAFAVVGAGLGIALTPRNTVAMNSVPAGKAGAAAGVVSTVSGLGAALGVSVSGTVYEELRLRNIERLLEGTGPHLSGSSIKTTEGILAGTSAARRELARLSDAAAARVVHAVRESFALSLGGTIRVSAFLAVAGLLVAAAIMRGSPAQEAHD